MAEAALLVPFVPVSWVIWTLLCPSRSEATFVGTPPMSWSVALAALARMLPEDEPEA